MRFIKIEIIWFLNVCIQYQQENCDTKPGFAVTIQNLVGVPFCQPHTHLTAHHFHHFNNQILLLKNSVENHIDYISYLHRQTGWYLGTSRYLIRKDDPYLLKQPQPERGTGCITFGEDILYYTDRQTNRWTDRQGDTRVPSGTSLDRTFFTFLNDLCLREGQGVVLGRDLLYGASVQNLWLKEHTGVRVPDAA